MTNTFDNLDKYIVKFTQIHIFAGHLTVLREAMVWCRTAGGWSDVRHKSPKCSLTNLDGFHRQTFSMMITRIFFTGIANDEELYFGAHIILIISSRTVFHPQILVL